jgi:hypothetical protein
MRQQWMTLEEVEELYPRLRCDTLGRYEGVRYYPGGESVEAMDLRRVLKPRHDDQGRLEGLYPVDCHPPRTPGMDFIEQDRARVEASMRADIEYTMLGLTPWNELLTSINTVFAETLTKALAKKMASHGSTTA